MKSLAISRSDRFALGTILLLLSLSALMHVLHADDGDKAWLLYVARMWMHGHRLYADVVEVNPPLILWLYGLAVWLSLQMPLFSDSGALGLMGLLGCALSAALSTWLIRRHPAFAGNRRKCLEFLLLLAAIFVAMTPQTFFFDREHILLVMTFPYILRFMPSLACERLPTWLRLCVGGLAALGFCIKPHSVILFLAVQLMFILRERSAAIVWSLENGIIALAGLAYLFCIWQFTPEYVSIILPMAVETYTSFGRTGSSLFYLPPVLFCFCLTFADFRPRYSSPYRRDAYYFLGILAAFLLHAIVSNGWDYTYYPLLNMLLFLSGWMYWEYQWLEREYAARGASTKQFAFGMRGCAMSLASQGIYTAVLMFLSMEVLAIQTRCERAPECLLKDPYVRYVRDHAARSFGTITLDYPRWVLLARRSGAQWATRFNHLWMLPKLLEDGKDAARAHDWITQYVTRALADDLNGRKPDIVFVDTGRQFFAYPRYDDLLDFLNRSAEFKAAWSRYRYTTTINSCDPKDTLYLDAACRYDVYSRLH